MKEEEESRPSALFLRACQRARVAEEHQGRLWRIHLSWQRPGNEAERVQGLMEEYAHWRLFERGRAGDARAARRFERTWRQAAAAFLGRGFRAEQVDEFLAAFFERAYDRLRDFDWERPFSAYLRMVLLNLSRDELRRVRRARQRELSLDVLEGPRGAAASEPSPEDALISRERDARVQKALDALEPIDRHVLLECLVEGRSGKELAAALGISVAAVHQRLSRARKRLRRILDRSGF